MTVIQGDGAAISFDTSAVTAPVRSISFTRNAEAIDVTHLLSQDMEFQAAALKGLTAEVEIFLDETEPPPVGQAPETITIGSQNSGGTPAGYTISGQGFVTDSSIEYTINEPVVATLSIQFTGAPTETPAM